MHELTILSSGSVSAPVDAGTLAYTAGSLSGTLDSTDIKIYKYRLIGTVTLSGASSISYSGTASKNEAYFFHYEASVTPSGNTFSIFGQAVPSDMLASKFVAECVYDGSAWKVKLLPSFDGLGIIGEDRLAANSVTTAKVADDAVTLAKMAGLAKGKIIYGDASGNPADIELGSADGRMLLGDTAAGVAAVDMSGDATISKAGALTIANNAISTVKVADGAITPVKMSAGARKSSIAIPVYFDTAGEIGVLKYTMCFDCTVDAIHATVTKAAATDTATAIFKNHGGTVLTGSQIDITTGLVLGNIVTTTPTANNTFLAGEQITIETSKTTAGSGNFTAILCLTHD
jgi:hypothetical protein